MFKSVVSIIATLFMTTTLNTQAQTTIELPAPLTSGGMSLAEALSQRHSTREFDPAKELTSRQISDLLWSAAGINRPESGMRTNPTALNTQEIDLYLFDKDGVYLYDPKANTLVRKAEGDHRALVAGTKAFSQDFVLDAPVSVVLIADLGRFERKGDFNAMMAAMDAGIVSENICLYCSAAGLATVPRATMDKGGINKLLGLSDEHVPMLNNPVGYAK